MKKNELSILDLEKFKIIMNDAEETILEYIRDSATGEMSNKKKREIIIKDILNDNLSLDTPALKKAMEDLKIEQNKKTDNNIIEKLDDIESSENYSDFITFIEDDKQYFVIGDLHDDMKTFSQILEAINFKNNFDNINLVFLGDYVDRGKDRFSLIKKIIFLKYLLPNNIHLLRGNHELYKIDEKGNYISPMQGASPQHYHFDLLSMLITSDSKNNQQFVKENGIDKELIKTYADFFDSMPTIALFNFKNIKICAMHGGLPRIDLNSEDYYGSENYKSFNKLLDIDTKDNIGIIQKVNILWSDPYEGHDEGFRNTSEIRYDFSRDQFIAFCKKYNIDMLLRAHEKQSRGFKSYFGERLVSVFSSGGKNKDGQHLNKNSYYENVSPNILKITDNTLESININFDTDKISEVEGLFEYIDIKSSRKIQEKDYKVYLPKKRSDLFENIKRIDGAIQIIDRYNQKNKRVLVLKEDKITFIHNDLKDFNGINKNLKFSIDIVKKTVTNLSDLTLQIGIDGSLLSKDESIKVADRFIMSFDNSFSLIITI